MTLFLPALYAFRITLFRWRGGFRCNRPPYTTAKSNRRPSPHIDQMTSNIYIGLSKSHRPGRCHPKARVLNIVRSQKQGCQPITVSGTAAIGFCLNNGEAMITGREMNPTINKLWNGCRNTINGGRRIGGKRRYRITVIYGFIAERLRVVCGRQGRNLV